MLPVLLSSGEPQRTYKFVYILLPNSLNAFGVSSGKYAWVPKTLNVAALLYISQLAQKVQQPELSLDVVDALLGSIKVPIPKGINIKQIVVTYLEDALSSVYLFHRQWYNLLYSQGGNLSFSELGNASVSCAYGMSIGFSPDPFVDKAMGVALAKANGITASAGSTIGVYVPPVRVPALSDIPSGLDIYPSIVPLSIVRAAGDKASDGVGTVTVTYMRIPYIAGIMPLSVMKGMSTLYDVMGGEIQ